MQRSSLSNWCFYHSRDGVNTSRGFYLVCGLRPEVFFSTCVSGRTLADVKFSSVVTLKKGEDFQSSVCSVPQRQQTS